MIDAFQTIFTKCYDILQIRFSGLGISFTLWDVMFCTIMFCFVGSTLHSIIFWHDERD